MAKENVAVIIPCYNEGIAIAKVVDDFKQIIPEAKIYVYDNNSTDNTVEEAKKPAPLSAMKAIRAREMLSAGCLPILTLTFM